jgi:hypothetical protein
MPLCLLWPFFPWCPGQLLPAFAPWSQQDIIIQKVEERAPPSPRHMQVAGPSSPNLILNLINLNLSGGIVESEPATHPLSCLTHHPPSPVHRRQMPLNVSAKGPPSATVLDTFQRRQPPEMPGHPLLFLPPSLCPPSVIAAMPEDCRLLGCTAALGLRQTKPGSGQDGAGVGQDQLSPRVLARIWGATAALLPSSLRQKKGVPGWSSPLLHCQLDGWPAGRDGTGQDHVWTARA